MKELVVAVLEPIFDMKFIVKLGVYGKWSQFFKIFHLVHLLLSSIPVSMSFILQVFWDNGIHSTCFNNIYAIFTWAGCFGTFVRIIITLFLSKPSFNDFLSIWFKKDIVGCLILSTFKFKLLLIPHFNYNPPPPTDFARPRKTQRQLLKHTSSYERELFLLRSIYQNVKLKNAQLLT